MYKEIKLFSQSIILFNERNPEEEYGAIEIKKVAVLEGSVLKASIKEKWEWIAGIYLMEAGDWKFEKVLAINKLHRVMNLNSYFSSIQIMNHTRWNSHAEPLFPWWVEGDSSGGTMTLNKGSIDVDFKVKLKK